MNGQNSLDIMAFFINAFEISTIYDLGWQATKEWMIFISGTLIAIGLGIRHVQDQVATIDEGKPVVLKTTKVVLLAGVGMALYFTVASLLIDFFNVIYSATGSNSSMMRLTQDMDKLLSTIINKEFDLEWGDIINSVYVAFAFCVYAITYCVLVFVIFAMRMAHAMLFSFAVFWGAIAIPMSIPTGIDQLKAWKNILITALIWPIIEAFLMYMVGGTFAVTMDKSGFSLEEFARQDTITLSQLLFFLGVFSIMNLFLIATTVAAPFIAQGIANGTGNVTGLIGSFAGAGIAAGAIVGKNLADNVNAAGNKAWGKNLDEGGMGIKAGMQKAGGGLMGSDAEDGGQGLKAAGQRLVGSADMNDGSNPVQSVKNALSSWNNAEEAPWKQKSDTGSDTVSDTSSNNKNNATSENSDSSKSSGKSSSSNNNSPKQSAISNDSNMSEQQQIDSEGDSSDSGMQQEEDRKRKQAQRGVIINNQKK